MGCSKWLDEASTFLSKISVTFVCVAMPIVALLNVINGAAGHANHLELPA